MVGRVAELAQLRQAYDRATAGGGVQLFTVVGPAGIGKTRLAAELLRSLGEETTVLRGHSLSYGEAITFWPLREMVLQIPDLDAALAGEAEAATIRDRVLGAVGLDGNASSNEDTFWATRRLLEALARERPLVVVLEDVHWAEPALLDLIEHVSEWSVDSPILLLCLSRPELIDDRPRWAGGRANVASVVLEPLTAEECDELIELILDGGELAPELRVRINEAAEGNPLFIEQMLAMLAEQGANGRLSIPPTIQALLAARLEHLGELERGALQRASIMGRDFRRAALVGPLAERRGRRDRRRPRRSSSGASSAARRRRGLPVPAPAAPGGRVRLACRRPSGPSCTSASPSGSRARGRSRRRLPGTTSSGPTGIARSSGRSARRSRRWPGGRRRVSAPPDGGRTSAATSRRRSGCSPAPSSCSSPARRGGSSC